MSMYRNFRTDDSLEKEGIVLDYGTFRVTIARAGGANKRFAQLLDAKAKPYRRAIATETLDNEKGSELLREVYAEAVIRKWETKAEDGSWQEGVEQEDGSVAPYSKAAVLKALTDLPDLFMDIQEQAQKVSLFRKSVREAEAGN